MDSLERSQSPLIHLVRRMATPTTQSEIHDVFVHELAIKLSRALNLINPNDLLARRVIDIAQNNSADGFISGMTSCYIDSKLQF